MTSPLIVSIGSAGLALLSFGVSFWTFYYTYWSEGDLDFISPPRIGISYPNSQLLILFPVTLTNTGSTRYRAQILEIAADLSTNVSNKMTTTFHMRWENEVAFISTAEYFSKYQEWIKRKDPNRSLDDPDQLVNVTRAFPFQLIGGSFVSKSYTFVEVAKDGDADNPSGREATLNLYIQTKNTKPQWRFQLKIPELSPDRLTYVDIRSVPISR